jgi:hypothetical protein
LTRTDAPPFLDLAARNVPFFRPFLSSSLGTSSKTSPTTIARRMLRPLLAAELS